MIAGLAPAAANVGAALAHARSRRPQAVADLRRFAAFATVGADPRCAAELRRAATWLCQYLADSGLQHARVIATPGAPVVYADWLHALDRPTLLVYGHYDVQPADPLGEWHSPPFVPTLRGERLVARGITDDKGQLMAHLFALRSYLRASSRLPVNVRVVVEGEEETGSEHFGAFVERHRDALRCDAAVVSDTPMLGPDRPALTYSLRGGLSCEVEVTGQTHDLHSGLFGGAIRNPLQAACELIATLHSADGRVSIAGFYDRVRQWDARERNAMARAGPSDADVAATAGARRLWGEPAYTAYERTTIRPSLSLNGLVGGYQGAGSKAVIPSRAVAKLNLRLVPDQAPRDILRLLRRHVRQASGVGGVRMQVVNPTGVRPVQLGRDGPAVQAATRALRRGFGAAPAFVRNGGTIAAVSDLVHRLGVPVVLMGFALPDARLHAPDENLHVPTFFRSIETAIWFLSEL